MKHLLVDLPNHTKWSIIYDVYVDICDDNYRAAALLREIEFLAHERGSDKFLDMSESYLLSRCKIPVSHTAYMRAMEILKTKGFVSVDVRVGCKQKVKFNLETVQKSVNDIPPPSQLDLIENDVVAFNLVGNDYLPSRKELGTSSEKTRYLVGNDYNEYKSTIEYKAEYANSTSTEIPSSASVVPESLHAYALSSYGGTFGDRSRDCLPSAILDINPGSESEIAVDCKVDVMTIKGSDELLPNPSSIACSELKNTMTPNDVVQSILIKYAKLPNSQKHARQKGSATKLFTQFGDLLLNTVRNDGESAIAAFASFLQDPYWTEQKWPFFAFAKQYDEFLMKGSGSEPPADSDSSTGQKNAKSGYSNKRSTYPYTAKIDNEPAQRFIPVYTPDVHAKARHKREEVFTLLQSSGSSFFDDGFDALYGPITPELCGRIDSWHDKAVSEFKTLLKRDPIIKCGYKLS